MNLIDVFISFGKIPNALNTVFLSHSQPPLDFLGVKYLIDKKLLNRKLEKKIIYVIEKELFWEWLDLFLDKEAPRQNYNLVKEYGFLTRYMNIHFDPFLASCEDGKDHNWISIKYGCFYFSVQLNSIIYGILVFFEDYYQRKDEKRSNLYSEIKKIFYNSFQKLFWVEKHGWNGFKNYSILEKEKGSILYGDLSAEVFPLFFGLVTKDKVEIVKENLKNHYKGDIGLAATSLILRKKGSIKEEPYKNISYQWEYPNCWPPLMYFAVEGLKRYHFLNEALEYEFNFVNYLELNFKEKGCFFEKYPYLQNNFIEKGFYGNLPGFG